jgi:hypothetical protein
LWLRKKKCFLDKQSENFNNSTLTTMSRQGTANSINNQIPNHQAPPSPRQMGRATANNIRDQLNSLNDALPPISPSAHSSLASRGGTAEGRQQPILTTSANRVIKTNQSSIGTKSKGT